MRARPSCGFTLLELLVALAVFAVLATLAYGSLGHLLSAREQLAASTDALGRLQLAFSLLERDCLAASPRPVRDELGDPQPALRRAPDGSLELTQGGWGNPLEQPRAELQRVTWRLAGGVLYRDAWPVLDRVPGSRPQAQRVLDGVSRFEVDLRDGHTDKALAVMLELAPFGRIERLLLVGGGA